MKTAIVTGAPGQDAAWLSRQLLSKDYRVVCTYRYSSTPYEVRFANYPNDDENLITESCDIIDPSACIDLIKRHEPDEVYNLAAASHVGESFKNPCSVFDINTKAVVNFLEAIRKVKPDTKFLQASTSEMWGSNYTVGEDGTKYQDEDTPFMGNSPYAVAKIAAHNMVKLYRESYDMFCCSSICHNHESEYRGENFVTRKITKYIARLNSFLVDCGWDVGFAEEDIYYLGDHDIRFPKLRLGNVKAVRDWSHAADFTRGMHMMLQSNEPDDYVLASGRGRSVEDFLSVAFGFINADYNQYYVVDPQFYRPCEVEFLQGRADKIRQELGWEPQIPFEELVTRMVEYDKGLVEECRVP